MMFLPAYVLVGEIITVLSPWLHKSPDGILRTGSVPVSAPCSLRDIASHWASYLPYSLCPSILLLTNNS